MPLLLAGRCRHLFLSAASGEAYRREYFRYIAVECAARFYFRRWNTLFISAIFITMVLDDGRFIAF